jgi:hypothetical protein
MRCSITSKRIGSQEKAIKYRLFSLVPPKGALHAIGFKLRLVEFYVGAGDVRIRRHGVAFQLDTVWLGTA